MNILPYVYKGIHKSSGHFYIGYRMANTSPSVLDLGSDYFTSSDEIEALGFINFDWEIIAEFPNGDLAYDFEQRLIKENFDDHLCLNNHYIDVDSGHQRFRHSKPHSEESKSKMRESRKGIPAHNKGKPMSDDTKKKLSEINKGKPAPNKGVPMSEEAKEKLRIANTGKVGTPLTEEHKEKLRIANTGRVASEEARRKMSDSHRGQIPYNKGKPMADESKEKLRQANLGKTQSDETKRKKSEAAKLAHQRRKQSKEQ